MRKRIQQFAGGEFNQKIPEIRTDIDRIVLNIPEGETDSGSFLVRSTNHVIMHGMVYSSNPRMLCETSRFEGAETEIRFSFQTKGLQEGEVQQGVFTILCEGNEMQLPFSVSVGRFYLESSQGKVKNLDDFVRLLQKEEEEAYRMFYGEKFAHLLRSDRERLLYESLGTWPRNRRCIEEFLVALRKKNRVELSFIEPEREHYAITADQKFQLELTRSDWGAMEIDVATDADFIELEKKTVSEKEFLGNSYMLGYVVRAGKLHAGKNYGRIIADCGDCHLVHQIMVTAAPEERITEKSVGRKIQEAKASLTELYLEYRLRRLVTGVWAKKTIDVLEQLILLEPQNRFWLLLKAQAFFINRQKQEASWIMSEFKRMTSQKNTVLWGYYLYLCTLMEPEKTYVDRLTEEIEQIYEMHPNSGILFWILLFLEEDYYKNPQIRWKSLERKLKNGENSPFLYLEAYYLFWQDPYLLTQLGNVEIRILNWAAKRDALSLNMVRQIAELLQDKKEFSVLLDPVLEKCYETDPSDEMTAVICAYLIRGHRFEPKYHKWYERGISCKIRITNLYEAFVLSMEDGTETEIPKVLPLYFQYESSIPYPYIARLYATVIQEKRKYMDLYKKCRKSMEQYAIRQLEEGHIDDNLAIVYRNVLSDILVQEELAQKASEILFTHRLVCRNRKMARAFVFHQQLAEVQNVPVVNGIAYFQAYTDDYVVILQDTTGRCYAGEQEYLDDALFVIADYLEKCRKLAPGNPQYAFAYLTQQSFNPEQEKDCIRILLKENILSDTWKRKLLFKLLKDEKTDYPNTEIEGLFLKMPVEMFNAEISDAKLLAESLLGYGQYEKAMAVVRANGCDQLSITAKRTLCCHLLAQNMSGAAIAALAYDCMKEPSCQKEILNYLIQNYKGPTRRLEKIWLAARKAGIPAGALEERLLTQMLYTGEKSAYMNEIYESYRNGKRDRILCLAYLSYCGWLYLVQGRLISEKPFEEMLLAWKEDREQSGLWKICLLKYLTEHENASEEKEQLQEELLADCLQEHLYFEFYQKLPQNLQNKYHLQDKFYLEYDGQPNEQIRLAYCLNDGKQTFTRMEEVYPGIYVSCLILFYKDKLTYQITEETSGERLVRKEGILENKNIGEGRELDRYQMINQMQLAKEMKNEELLESKLKEYNEYSYMVKDSFKLL